MTDRFKGIAVTIATLAALVASGGSAAADRVLGADEIRKLVSGNTVQVTVVSSGKQWKIYFAPDGKGYESEGEPRGTWEVKDDGEHCVTWAPKNPCARVADIGAGKYARIKGNGEHITIWTIEPGKKL